jgi:type II secretory pathway pseudopilin PulG
MRRGLKLRDCRLQNRRQSQRGYMLISLMLAFALMTLALLAVLPDIKQQIRRDREDELRHRGTAYMRAIQHFNRKFGRYPSRIEDLENTNNIRFLRKRYADPVNRDPATGKEREFKFLRQTDISLNNGSLGQTPGLNAPAGQAFSTQGGSQGPGGGFGGGPGGFGGQGGLGRLQGGVGGLGVQTQPGGANAQTPASDDSGNASSTDENAGTNTPGSSSPNAGAGTNSSSGFNGPTLGGGPIIGVASTSKEKSVHVFFDKDHYKDWLFIYLAQGDRGGLLVGPVQPGMQSGVVGGLLPGQGQGQGVMPNGIQNQGINGPTPQTPQNPGQTPQQQ